MKLICPHCQGEFDRAPVALIPDDQKLTVRLESETDMFAADSLGEILANITKALQGCADALNEGPLAVFVSGMSVMPKEVTIDLVMTRVKKRPDATAAPA